MSGSKFFSVLDLNQAYHQVELNEQSRYITTFSTHVGLYRYKRLAFGITSAAEIFHNIIRELLIDLPGVVNCSDDILVHASTEMEHDKRLKIVMDRLTKKNLTFNAKKQKIKQRQVRFFGLIIGDQGVEMDPAKVSAIVNFSKPESVSEIRSFLGMTTWCSRFIKSYADLSEPLRKQISSASFRWNSQCERAFEKLKQSLVRTDKLAFFNQKLKTELIVDASPKGLGRILAQIDKHGKRKIIAYASKALNETQQRYSQIEREALAIIWGCEHFRLYLLKAKFTVITDPKPLVSIFNKLTSNLSARMERWMLRKQPFNFIVEYQPGDNNAADYLSRHAENKGVCKRSTMADEYVRYVTRQAIPKSISAAKIAEETKKDLDFKYIMSAIATGKWYPLTTSAIKSFHLVKEELTVTSEGIILRGTRICIPPSLQQRVLKQAHDGHMGINRTKALLRTRVWFPTIDAAVEKMIKNCLPWKAASSTPQQRDPIVMSKLPEYPWQQLSMDFKSLPSGEELLVLIDDFSRFSEVEIIPTTSHKHVIPKLDRILSTFGTPETIRTDNGSPFNGAEFRQYCEQLGIKHRKITPNWPEANGLAERFMRTLGKVIKTANIERKDWKRELYQFLRNYRATPHPATSKSPHEVLMGWKSRTLLPDLKHTDESYKAKVKQYADKRRRTSSHQLCFGDKALIRKEKAIFSKSESIYEVTPVIITEVKGSRITAKFEDTGRIVTRNSSSFKKFPNPEDETDWPSQFVNEEEEESGDEFDCGEEIAPADEQIQQERNVHINEPIIENNQQAEQNWDDEEFENNAVYEEDDQPNPELRGQAVRNHEREERQQPERRSSSKANRGVPPDRYQAGN